MRTLLVRRLLFRNFTVAAAATLLSCAQVTAAQIDASASFSLDMKKSQVPGREGLESKIPARACRTLPEEQAVEIFSFIDTA
jgi:hypothetical protein